MRSITTGRRGSVALALAASFAALAIGGPQAALAQEPQMGGTIVAAVEGEPASVDPAFDYDFVSGLATSSITEPLLVFCEDRKSTRLNSSH